MIVNMKKIIIFVVTLSISVARSVDVYVSNDYDYYCNQSTTKPEPSPLFIFGYHSDDVLSMQIYLKNKALDVSSEVYLKYSSGVKMHRKQLLKYSFKGKPYYQIRNILSDKKIFIELDLYTPSGFCTRIQIVKGIKVADEISDERYQIPYNDICLKDQWCVIEVDLINNECGESTNQQPTSSSTTKIVLICAIISITVMCIVVVAYIVVKKHCHQNPHSVRTVEPVGLNTCTTANEVTYAELCLVRGDRQLSRRDEESPYAEIRGVLNPR